ncbi:hypothetical protein HAX54_028707 [Datura stramonium]|uniref:Uncharacterized protein n=1 Tax=Datura stramonium TaxID=4076 RepID=A0ABS8S9V0_DATST|nr:hypothetical protein [Datura stramonium]
MEAENDDYHKKERATAVIILVFASLAIASLFVAFSYYCYIRNKVAKRFKNRTYIESVCEDKDNSFANLKVIAEGTSVYRGVLQDGRKVAIKLMDQAGKTGEEEFKVERSSVKPLNTICNYKKVKSTLIFTSCFIGSSFTFGDGLLASGGVAMLALAVFAVISYYCSESSHKLLVYEFMANGGLQEHLYPIKGSNSCPKLDWKTRLRIALEAAKGIARLTDRGKVVEIMDPALEGQYSMKEVIQVAAIAAMCVQPEADYRPLMTALCSHWFHW